MLLKLKRTPGIYLVGFMGSGKTTVGRLLARELGWFFCDLDDDIEEMAKLTIGEIFDGQGELEFRRLENEALVRRVRMIERGKPTVLSLGGGTFVQQNNYELLENNGVTIWLDPPFPVLKRRVQLSSHRPLAKDPARFNALYDERKPYYSRADFHIQEPDSPAALAAILRLPIF